MGFEPVANLLSPVESVGLTPFKCRFWAYKTGLLRPSCAQLFPHRPTKCRHGEGQRSAPALDHELLCKAIQEFVRQLSAIARCVSFELGVIRASRGGPIAVCIFRTVQTLFAAVSGSRQFAVEFARAFGLFTQELGFPCTAILEAGGKGVARAANLRELIRMEREDMFQHSLEIHTSCLKRSSAVGLCRDTFPHE